MRKNRQADWILRFVKGAFIGSGFILPGVSGGAMAAVFGIYERIISFLSHITRNFKENVLFFIPVGLGACAGIFLLSFPVKYLLEHAQVYTMWFFIGCIVGMVPSLVRQSGKHGRSFVHILIMLAVTAVATLLLVALGQTQFPSMPKNALTWIMSGALIGLGVIVPGLSPSNLLIFMGLYEPMTAGISQMNLGVILPLILGAAACVILLSRVMDYVFARAYTVLYHCILGVVLASTIVIVPVSFNYLSLGGLVCLVTCAAGAALAYGMSRLEDKYKPEG